jgi:UDP-GlcNAc3NAcA epimerase
MPEEINRKLVDDLSRWIYTPTDRCAETLRRENFSEDRIVNCGDVMFDRTLATVAGPAAVVERARPFIFVTVHRAENTNDRTRLFSIFDALLRLAAQIDVVVAIHPRTEKVLAESDRMDGYRRKIEFLPPLGHVETLRMVQAAKLVVSDSGGLPKEAAFLGKRSVLLRRQAVWTELVDQGYAALADPAVPDAIEKAVERLIEAGETREPIRGFGDGRAAAAIAEHIVAQLGVHR